MVLDATLLSTLHYKVRIKGKVEQSWEWSSALLRVVAIEKGPFGSPSTKVANLTLLMLKIFKTMEKSEFRVLIKHCFLMGKIVFKQSNGLISVIRSLFCRKQQLSSGTSTLNAAVQTQMILNAQVAQIRHLPRKTQKKTSTNLFWPIVN